MTPRRKEAELADYQALVLTGDSPSVSGAAANGAGLRAWGIAWGLRELGIEVGLVFPAENLSAECAVEVPWMHPLPRRALRTLPEELVLHRPKSPPALVYQHWGLFGESRADHYPGPLAVDLAGPHLLERAYWGAFDLRRSWVEKIRALRAADFLMMGGRLQAAYFDTIRLTAGFDAAPDSIADFVFPVREWQRPSGGSERNLPAAWTRDLERPLLLFCGLALPWQDPSWAIREALDALDDRGAGSLLLVSPPLPGVGGEPSEELRELERLLDRHPRAYRLGKLSFENVLALCREADAALDLFAPNPERRLAVPSRTAVYAATGLPILFNDYSEWSPRFRAAGEERLAGWAIPFGDAAALRRAIEETDSRAARPDEPSSYLRESLGPERNLAPLAEWVRAAPVLRDPPNAPLPVLQRSHLFDNVVRACDRHGLHAEEQPVVREALELAWPSDYDELDLQDLEARGVAAAPAREERRRALRRWLTVPAAPLAAAWATIGRLSVADRGEDVVAEVRGSRQKHEAD